MLNELSRRRFLSQAGAGISAVWVTAHWPQLVSAAEHARQTAQSANAEYKFEFFTPAEAAEIEAMAARIIPSDDTPGAREAGVIYFIDRGLTTFAVGDQQKYRDGFPELQNAVHEKFPAVEKFSSASPEQQDEILRVMDVQKPSGGRAGRNQRVAFTFFDTVRLHTITAFLIDPEFGGNRGAVGWKLIGRDNEHMFQPPFGYYDKDYPGWQPAPKSEDKK
jgi:gluconate 2-dehydrogenase gamma chain